MDRVLIIFAALKEIFGWKRAREERANSPEMRKNEEAKRDVKSAESAASTVNEAHNKSNLDRLRMEASE